MTTSKPEFEEFSIRGLKALNKMIKKDPSILTGEWKELAYKMFAMTGEQKDFIESCPKDLDKQLKKFLKDAKKHVKSGGEIELKVVQEDESVKALYMMQIPKKEKSDKGTPVLKMAGGLRIICCDAYCKDWHWCWSR